MAYAYFEIDEYLWFNEAIQGNINVAGLVFDDLIEETLDLGPEEVLTVYSDVLKDTIGLEEGDFKGIHWPAVGDSLTFSEFFGTPLRVRQTVVNVVMTNPLVPALIAHVHMDILHGVDIYWEEVSSELQCHSTYANAVPYYWEWIFESIEIDMTEPQPLPPITLALYLLQNDLVNMRHEVIQEYFFNSKCFEEFFAWDRVVWGWYHLVDSPLCSADAIEEIIGKVADEYILLGDLPEPLVKVLHIVGDRIFGFDTVTDEKYYLLTAEDSIDVGDVIGEIFGQLVHEALIFQGITVNGLIRYFSAIDAIHAVDASVSERYYLLLADETVEMADGVVTFPSLNMKIEETFNAGAVAVTLGITGALASESLIFADIDSYIHGLLIEDGFALGDEELAKWVFNVLVASGCNVSDIIG